MVEFRPGRDPTDTAIGRLLLSIAGLVVLTWAIIDLSISRKQFDTLAKEFEIRIAELEVRVGEYEVRSTSTGAVSD
jgi:hypothetical protein